MAIVNSTATLTPPTSGADAYNNDVRPGLGQTYYDSTFGEHIKQLSDIGVQEADETMYAHCLVNADGTMYIQRQADATDHTVRYIADGSIVRSAQPDGIAVDTIWHPTDPDKYLYLTGSTILARSMASGTSSTLYTTASPLTNGGPGSEGGNVGGTNNWIDKTGRYVVVRYGGAAHVIDLQEGVYTGTSLPNTFDAGYYCITPDAKYVIRNDSTDTYAYPLDHDANTVGAAIIPMRGVASPSEHAIFMSTSDGKNWGIYQLDNVDDLHHYKIDISIDRTGWSAAAILADATAILTLTSNEEIQHHVANGPIGAGQDWAFFATEFFNGDAYNSAPSPWARYRQEILAVNVVTGTVRRLAHHRSRGITDARYWRMPRTSCAWDGSVVIWASNMNQNSSVGGLGYSDIYGIENPLGGGFKAAWARSANPQGALV